MTWSLMWCIPIWYVVAAAVLVVSAVAGALAGRYLEKISIVQTKGEET